MNNIAIDYEQHCHVPWSALTFKTNILIYLVQDIGIAMNNLDIYHEQYWHMPWTTLPFTMINIDI